MTLEERFAQCRAGIVSEFGEEDAESVEDLARVIGLAPVVEFVEASQALGAALERLRCAIQLHYGGCQVRH